MAHYQIIWLKRNLKSFMVKQNLKDINAIKISSTTNMINTRKN